MTQYIIKIIISAAVIVAVSEIAKRSALLGGLLASLPIISFMAMIWLYVDTKDAAKVASLSINIFWLVLPSLVFFLVLPWLLKMKVHFIASFVLATTAMLLSYGLILVLARKLRLIV
jgi:F0F1-type ATP synthase assembly protein I